MRKSDHGHVNTEALGSIPFIRSKSFAPGASAPPAAPRRDHWQSLALQQTLASPTDGDVDDSRRRT
jgi:hypothetical protein